MECKCGCGGLVKWGRSYINHHNMVGVKRSVETRRKMSELKKGKKLSRSHVDSIQASRKGYKHSEETKKKMSFAHKDKVLSDEHKLKLSKAKLGKKRGPHSEEHRRKIAIANMGINSSQWKGGIAAEPYCDVWLDKEFKESIKERDNYECQNPDCWGTSGELVPHHIDYDKKNCHPNNLITLCRSCNTRSNVDRGFWKQLYTEIMEGNNGNRHVHRGRGTSAHEQCLFL